MGSDAFGGLIMDLLNINKFYTHICAMEDSLRTRWIESSKEDKEMTIREATQLADTTMFKFLVTDFHHIKIDDDELSHLLSDLETDIEWAEANEWESPIMLYDNLKKVYAILELIKQSGNKSF